MTEDEEVKFRPAGPGPFITAAARAGLVHHAHPHPVQILDGHLLQPRPQVRTVVVPMDRQQPAGSLLELVEQLHHHPVTGVHDEVRPVHLSPDVIGQGARPAGDVGVSQEQKAHSA